MYAFRGIVLSCAGTSYIKGNGAVAIDLDSRLSLPFGMYAVEIRLHSAWQRGIARIGMHHMVQGSAPAMEVCLPDYESDIVEKGLDVRILECLQEEMPFAAAKDSPC